MDRLRSRSVGRGHAIEHGRASPAHAAGSAGRRVRCRRSADAPRRASRAARASPPAIASGPAGATGLGMTGDGVASAAWSPATRLPSAPPIHGSQSAGQSAAPWRHGARAARPPSPSRRGRPAGTRRPGRSRARRRPGSARRAPRAAPGSRGTRRRRGGASSERGARRPRSDPPEPLDDRPLADDDRVVRLVDADRPAPTPSGRRRRTPTARRPAPRAATTSRRARVAGQRHDANDAAGSGTSATAKRSARRTARRPARERREVGGRVAAPGRAAAPGRRPRARATRPSSAASVAYD